MKLLLFLSIGALAYSVGSGAVFAHDCCHHTCGNGYHGCDHCGSPMNSQNGTQSKESSPANRVVNLKTLEGKIVEVIYLPGVTPESGMVDVRVQTSNGANLVRLAPSGFLKQSGLRLQEGDAVTMEAFPVAAMKGDLMVAMKVHGNGLDVRLRDSSGQPLW
jgi:translation initiation factor IF-1